jgi:hypothetical protein
MICTVEQQLSSSRIVPRIRDITCWNLDAICSVLMPAQIAHLLASHQIEHAQYFQAIPIVSGASHELSVKSFKYLLRYFEWALSSEQVLALAC